MVSPQEQSAPQTPSVRLDAFSGRSVLVTGGGSGIGKSCVEWFAQRGARVAVLDTNPDAAAAVAQEWAEKSVTTLALTADVSDEDAFAAALAQIVDTWGGLDVAINNAGVEGARGSFHEYDLAEFDRIVRVNIRGAFVCLKHEIALMLGAGHGSIVNMASAAAFRAGAGMPVYGATKAALTNMTRNAAREYGPAIRVNAVCPGSVRTPMQERIRGVAGELVEWDVPMGRTATAVEIAAAAGWLASDDAGYLTGVCLPVDGGYSLG